MKSRNKILFSLSLIAGGVATLLLSSCSTIPKNAKPIENFELARYLGSWYEIARFDFRFEKDLNNTMAQYSLDAKGNVKVVNSGYNYVKDKWTSAEGLAKFRGEENVAALKVSFFGPFYAGYNVIAIDDDYKYALVVGKNLEYLWILSREKTIPEDIKEKYLRIADAVGYDMSNLIWVEHDKKSPFDEYLKSASS